MWTYRCQSCRDRDTLKMDEPCWSCHDSDKWRSTQRVNDSKFSKKEEQMNYRVLKDISLLSIAQAGPKDCAEFRTEYISLVTHLINRHWNGAGVLQKGETRTSGFCDVVDWAEKNDMRIQWLIDKGFIERVDELKPCPFCPKGRRVAIFETEGGWYVRCDYCHARGPYEGRRQDAIELWNGR